MTDWYVKTGNPSTRASGLSAVMRAEFALIEAAFAKLPTYTGNALYPVRVNSGGTGLEAVAPSTLAASLLSEAVAFTGDITPSQITANQNDYNPTGLSTASVLRLSTDASRNITGLQGGSDGRVVMLENVGSFDFVLKDSDAGSSAANRFALDADITVRPDWCVMLKYDSTASRWRMIGSQNVAQATGSLTEDTAPDLIADFLHAYDTSASSEKKIRLATLLGLAAPPGQGVLLNGLVVTSVGSNALTIAIKGADGNDPSASNPVFVAFRSATLGTAGFTVRRITAALSMTVSSGSTLGHASGSACHLFAYLIDNSGTVEVAVSNLPPDYPGTFANTRLISTTPEGGAGAADSATGIYSTTGRSNVPWVCVAMCKSTQTTAGTWAAAITQIDQAPFVLPTGAFAVYLNGNQTVSASTWTKLAYALETYDVDATFDTTNNRHQPNIAGLYFYTNQPVITAGAGGQAYGALYKNGAAYSENKGGEAGAVGLGIPVVEAILMNGTTDYVEGYGWSASTTFDGSDSKRSRMSGWKIGAS